MKPNNMIEIPPPTPITAADNVQSASQHIQKAMDEIVRAKVQNTVLWSILCSAQEQLRIAGTKMGAK